MRWLNKLAKPISALGHADPSLPLTYRFWSNQRNGGLIPPRCAVDTPSFRLISPDVHWVGCRSINEASELNLGSLHAFAHAKAWGQKSAFADVTIGELLQQDLRNVVDSGAPLFQLIQLEVCGSIMFYQHLVLPTSDDGTLVNELLQLVKVRILETIAPSVTV